MAQYGSPTGKRLTLAEARNLINSWVVYVPAHGPREDGTIASVNDRYVMVNYGGKVMATDAGDLELQQPWEIPGAVVVWPLPRMSPNAYTGQMVRIRTSKMSSTVRRELNARWNDYRWERDRQERELENVSGGHPEDEAYLKDMGIKQPITFKEWLKGQGATREKDSWDAGGGHDADHTYSPDPAKWGEETLPW